MSNSNRRARLPLQVRRTVQVEILQIDFFSKHIHRLSELANQRHVWCFQPILRVHSWFGFSRGGSATLCSSAWPTWPSTTPTPTSTSSTRWATPWRASDSCQGSFRTQYSSAQRHNYIPDSAFFVLFDITCSFIVIFNADWNSFWKLLQWQCSCMYEYSIFQLMLAQKASRKC